MYAKNSRTRWVFFLFLLAGMVLGAFLGHYLSRYSFLEWMDYGQAFGLTDPATLSLGIISVTLGFTVRFNVASLIGLALGVVAYKFTGRV